VLECLDVPPDVVLRRPFKPPIDAGWTMPIEEMGLGAQNKVSLILISYNLLLARL
jgi:hypothetical protein